MINKPKSQTIRVSLDRVRRCPREMIEYDDANEVPVSDLFEDPDVVKETETSRSSDIAKIPASVPAQSDKEGGQKQPVHRSNRLKPP